jgi:hypothetical protein
VQKYATPVTIENTQVTNNSVLATDLNGEPVAINAAIGVNDNPLTMAGSVISGNRAVTEGATTADQGVAGGAVEIDGGGTVRATRITDNYSATVSAHGAAGVAGALGVFGNSSLLALIDDTVSGNSGTATGPRNSLITRNVSAPAADGREDARRRGNDLGRGGPRSAGSYSQRKKRRAR